MKPLSGKGKKSKVKGGGASGSLHARFSTFMTFSVALSLLLPVFALTPGVRADMLTLPEGLSIVGDQGYDVRIAQARESAAARSEDLARASRRPQVTAYADQTWLENRPEAVFGTNISPLSEDEFLRYGVTARQLITDFGRTGSNVRAARESAESQVLETWRVRNTAALDFVMAYISLLQADKTLTLTDLEVQRFESHLKDTQALYDAGEVTLNDVLTADVALADATLRRITHQDERNLAASRLNYLLLRPLEMETTPVDFTALWKQIPALKDESSRASANRPELKILSKRISAMEAQLNSKEAEHLPTLFVSGAYTYEENPYRVYEDNLSATVGLTWELYAGGAITAARKQIMDQLSALIAQREKTRELIHLEVRDSHRLLTGAVQRTSVTEKAVTQAQESLRLQKSRYAEGEATATDVTDAVTSLARAENNHWTAVYEKLKAEARLLYASGEDMVSIYSGSSDKTVDETYDTITGE